MIGNVKITKVDGEVSVLIRSSSHVIQGVGRAVPLMQMQGSRDQIVGLLQQLSAALERGQDVPQALDDCQKHAEDTGFPCTSYPPLLRQLGTLT